MGSWGATTYISADLGQLTSALPNGGVIMITNSGTITLTKTLSITANVLIDAGANAVTINESTSTNSTGFRLLSIPAGNWLVLRNLTLSGGKDVSAELNSTLVAKDRAGPYKHFVRKQLRPDVLQPNADELFHFLVHVKCDVSNLDADALVALQDEREPLRALKLRVQELASTLPAMKDPRERDTAFQQRANEIVKAWQNDRLNLSRYARDVLTLDAFGGGAGKFLSVMQDKLVPLGAAGVIGTTVGATAGLAIGLLTHLGTSYTKLKKAETDSPLRYMTLAENRGVNFSISQTKSDAPAALA
jgi:hypothetical protein